MIDYIRQEDVSSVMRKEILMRHMQLDNPPSASPFILGFDTGVCFTANKSSGQLLYQSSARTCLAASQRREILGAWY